MSDRDPDGLVSYAQSLEAEIERLRLEYAEIALRARQSAIEECARVIQNWIDEGDRVLLNELAAAIRALRDRGERQ